MTPEEVEGLRGRMGELVLLPHEDPRRQAMVDQLGQLDASFRREWLDLVRDDELLRIELARVQAPPGLEERLLAIASDAPASRGVPLRPRAWTRAAAALVVAGVVGWGTLAVTGRQAVARSLDHVALITMGCHESDPAVGIATSDWSVLESGVRGLVGYRVDRPTLDASFELLGGRAITLAGSTMICSRWKRDGIVYSLYQFCGKDFALKDPIGWQEVDPLNTDRARCQVIVWTESHCSYAMVFPRDAEPPPRPAASGS